MELSLRVACYIEGTLMLDGYLLMQIKCMRSTQKWHAKLQVMVTFQWAGPIAFKRRILLINAMNMNLTLYYGVL